MQMSSRLRLGVALAVATIMPIFGIASPVLAQGTSATSAARSTTSTSTSTTPRSRTRTAKSTITAVDTTANTIKVTTTAKNENLDVALTPETEFGKEEQGLTAGELKVGDTVSFSRKGFRATGIVTSLSPLTLKIEDMATLSMTKTEGVKFNRHTALTRTDLAANQTISLRMRTGPDGKIEGRRVIVIVTKPKTPRVRRSRATGTGTNARRAPNTSATPAESTEPEEAEDEDEE